MSFQADGSLVSGQLRIAAIAIAAFDIIRTIPSEYRFYKSSSPANRALLASVRYIGIAALLANASLYFASFTTESCHSVHLLPGILQLFAALAVQVVIFVRTLEISKSSRNAFAIMISAALISIPLEAVAIGLERQATLFPNELTKTDGCLSLVRSDAFNAGPVFYLARLGFDIFAIFLSTYHLLRRTGPSKLPFELVTTGIAFILVDALVNFLTFLASIGINGIQNLGSICSIVTAILVAQHVMFITRRPDTSNLEYTHEVLALPASVYKSSDPYVMNSTGTLPQFVNPNKRTPTGTSPNNTPYQGMSTVAISTRGDVSPGYQRSRPSVDGGASVLHSCVGREALKYRVDGDVNLFQSKTSLCMPVAEEDSAPIPLDVKRMSQRADKSRPTTGDSSDRETSD